MSEEKKRKIPEGHFITADVPDYILADMICRMIEAMGPSIKKTLDWHACDSVCHPACIRGFGRMSDSEYSPPTCSPCPFCGEAEVRPIRATLGSPAWSVCCSMCNAVGPFDVDQTEAVRLWNHRATAR